MYYAIAAVILLALIAAGYWWWRKRQRDNVKILSFVALLREPVFLDPAVVAANAGAAWDADLGDGENEGPDGFVAGIENNLVIRFGDRMVLVNNFPTPYVEDMDAAVEAIGELRLRKLVREHTAWLSVDALGADDLDNEQAVRRWYRLLARLFTRLVDDNCLVIFLPLTGQMFPNMEETLDKLRSPDPFKTLMDDVPVPVVAVSDDDPAMQAAVAEARETWPEFVAAYEADDGESFSVKAPITGGGNTEFIWIEVTAIENDVIYGLLANDPIDLGPLKIGSKVTTSLSELNDWAYFDDAEEPHGMFTVKVLTGE